jgi:hypothetical protein
MLTDEGLPSFRISILVMGIQLVPALIAYRMLKAGRPVPRELLIQTTPLVD